MADFSPKDPLPILLYSSSGGVDDPPIPQSIHQKLTDAFANIQDDYGLYGLIQFWEPVNIDGRCLLTTSDQPFIVDRNYERSKEYRSCCEKYKYNIDKVQVEVEEEDPTNTIITTGPPATAFLNQMPEYLLLQRVDRMSPLVSSALQCGLKYSYMLPVFYPSQSFCVGVVECSIYSFYDFCYSFPYVLIDEALEKVGFKMFDARELLPYKSIHGLQHAKDEIHDVLRIISKALRLDVSQVWIAYEDEYLSSSLQDTLSKRRLWLKLTDSCYDDDEDDIGAYMEACYRVPMKMDQVFAGKTLQNSDPLFIRDIRELKNNEPQRLLIPFFSSRCSCFMICLRSTKTGELDYVFEFLWSEIQLHNDYILELLLFSLKRHLQSFKFASGAELGGELRILDAQASTETETKYIKIFQTNQLSHVSVTPKRGRRPEDEECMKAKCKTAKKEISREQIELEFGKTQKKAAENLKMSLSTLKRYCKVLGISEWPGKDSLNRNVKHLYKNTQRNPNEEEDRNGGTIQDNIGATTLNEDILTIKAEYADDTIKFTLPISSATFAAVEKEISEEFKLNPSDYKVKYLDEAGDWILLSSDKAMRECLRNHRNFNITPINMKVLLRKI